jgi:hypothetical protein
MDKSAVVLANPQIPLIKSRYMEVINGEENCYGENAIVAIMCYTGYNMEDAVLINEGALKRGLLRTTYYSTYETHEEKSRNSQDVLESEKIFTNIEKTANIIGTKPGFEYDHLDEYGIVREGTEVHDKMVLIGMSSMVDAKTGLRVDASKTPKKGQLGIVDKTFITDGEEGERIAKVRVREIRIPAIGDKMASRAGQKGTIGNIIPEADMPFTRDGLRPDIIINPHAIPSRMTIGQFVECITGKACAYLGAFGDGTAFNSKFVGQLSETLVQNGFHSSGNDILYNGMTGEQLETEIFIGPTYYMRLKHMVKDKINYRARGPRTALTKQPVSGRANDGGLRIGEMERDSIISHGATNFLTESMMERGDKYYMAVCNKTGMVAIYNESKNLFMSPMSDGPIQFVGSIAENNLTVEKITKHGRSFSVVCIPYSLKLLMQELQCANVAMRIITDDNIEQIENMSFSRNIDKLMFSKDAKPSDIVFDIRRFIAKNKLKAAEKTQFVLKDLQESLRTSEDELSKSKEYNTNTPSDYVPSPAYDMQSDEKSYNRPNSPEYAKGSPVFGDSPNSPLFVPMTPPSNYVENSQEYFNPESPEYAKGSHFGIGENGQTEYKIGDFVSRRGVQGNDNIWRIENVGPEFTTIKKYSPENLTGGGSSGNNFRDYDEVVVVDNNEIFPYSYATIQPHHYQMNPTNMVSVGPYGEPYGNSLPMIKTEEPYKPPDVNVVVVTGDKNELNGMPLKNSDDKSNGSQDSGGNFVLKKNVVGTDSEGAKEKEKESEKKSGGFFDFTNFLVKKV